MAVDEKGQNPGNINHEDKRFQTVFPSHIPVSGPKVTSILRVKENIFAMHSLPNRAMATA